MNIKWLNSYEFIKNKFAEEQKTRQLQSWRVKWDEKFFLQQTFNLLGGVRMKTKVGFKEVVAISCLTTLIIYRLIVNKLWTYFC